jgi:hypothetical protein
MPETTAEFQELCIAAEQIIRHLGAPINTSAYASNASAGIATHQRHGSSNDQVGKTPTKPAKVDRARLASLVHELQDTEGRYLKRIACLKMVGHFGSYAC